MEKVLISDYILKSKDIPLLSFSLYREIQHGLGVNEYFYTVDIKRVTDNYKYLLPYELRSEDTIVPGKLLKWIQRRKAPKNRQFVKQIMNSIGDTSNPLQYVDVSHALSLNDSFWITTENSDLKWNDVNLYSHPFDKILSYVAFTGYSQRISGLVSSPEITSSGMLKKCWTRRDNEIYLLKGDNITFRSDGRSQATMEYYACQIADKMNIDHIKYDLEWFHHLDGTNEMVCVCPIFTSDDVGFVDAYTYFRDNGLCLDNYNIGDLEIQTKMAHLFGIEEYQDLMVFDALICNQDRHLGNFGYLKDNNTGKYIRPAPVFDNGFSLLLGAARGNLNNIEEYISGIQGKYMDFDRQAQIFIQPRHKKTIRSLLSYNFKNHRLCKMDSDVLNKMSLFIQLRAKRLLEIYNKKINKDNSILRCS